MYVAVQHSVTDPVTFWKTAQEAEIPANLKLHQTFPTKDGSHGICIWEANSMQALRDFLDPATAGMASNEYFEVENKESMAMPSGVVSPAA